MVPAPHALVFDVNETLSDLNGMHRAFADVGAPPHLAPTWFAGVLRDGFALSVAGAPTGFAQVAAAGLRTLLAGHRGLGCELDAAVEQIMSRFSALAVYPDVRPGVSALAGSFRLLTLSNGAAEVAEQLLGRAGVRDRFAALLSVADAGAWKPDPQAYAYAARVAGLRSDELMLVAVHPWDIDGAHRAGLSTAYLDRAGVPYPSVFSRPDLVVRDLVELADRLGAKAAAT